MSFNAERLSHAYITDSAFADTLAMSVVCNAQGSKKPCMSCVHCDKAARRIHPDIIYIDRLDNKQIISVDQIRSLKKDIYFVPNDAAKKAYVINDAELMHSGAQNALLQVLEEPPSHTVFILSTSNPAALLSTVYSRCVDLKTHPSGIADGGSDETDELEEIVNDFFEALSGSNINIMESMFRIDKLDRHAFGIFLTLTRENIVRELRRNINNSNLDINKKLIRTENILTKAAEMLDLNVSQGHISGYICASII